MAVYSSSHGDQNNQPMAVRRYQIREKIFSLGDNFTIKDASGEDAFTVKSKLFSVGDKLTLEDMNGKYVNMSIIVPRFF